ncbi:MAG TPA: XdhC family protein [Candidatus Tyrphobacter sp.]
MREIFGTIARRLREPAAFVAATLIASRGAKASAIGTTLIVERDGSFCGDIGAGCHEAEIVERALEMLAHGGAKAQTLTFDLDDEVLAGTGCGASLDVALWMPERSFAPVAERIAAGEQDVLFALEGTTIVIPRRPRLAIVGATALAATLTLLAHRADYAVAIVDPRPAFATRARQPNADELIVAWPDDAAAAALFARVAAIAIVAHDVKLDLPALRTALASTAGYIGLLGNRRVQSARRAALREEGYDDAQLARIHGPAGLDLGGTTDGQTALSILAEMVAVLGRRSGSPLSRVSGPIHP